ncbi:conserved protein, unknown function [Hepatocystis sp. ex Piliocolobus tephrosceles]|nr:conserved protein, unknown function [Hepatocystis sp. ex Piliocolobus tephrosceles]
MIKMLIGLKRHVNKIYNIKNVFLKNDHLLINENKCWYNNHYFNKIVNIQSCLPKDNPCFFFNHSFLNILNKKKSKTIYEMRRDRGGTVRKKLSREKKKTQKKRKEITKDVHK